MSIRAVMGYDGSIGRGVWTVRILHRSAVGLLLAGVPSCAIIIQMVVLWPLGSFDGVEVRSFWPLAWHAHQSTPVEIGWACIH